eukprot:87120-Amphidinium_carterae.1
MTKVPLPSPVLRKSCVETQGIWVLSIWLKPFRIPSGWQSGCTGSQPPSLREDTDAPTPNSCPQLFLALGRNKSRPPAVERCNPYATQNPSLESLETIGTVLELFCQTTICMGSWPLFCYTCKSKLLASPATASCRPVTSGKPA